MKRALIVFVVLLTALIGWVGFLCVEYLPTHMGRIALLDTSSLLAPRIRIEQLRWDTFGCESFEATWDLYELLSWQVRLRDMEITERHKTLCAEAFLPFWGPSRVEARVAQGEGLGENFVFASYDGTFHGYMEGEFRDGHFFVSCSEQAEWELSWSSDFAHCQLEGLCSFQEEGVVFTLEKGWIDSQGYFLPLQGEVSCSLEQIASVVYTPMGEFQGVVTELTQSPHIEAHWAADRVFGIDKFSFDLEGYYFEGAFQGEFASQAISYGVSVEGTGKCVADAQGLRLQDIGFEFPAVHSSGQVSLVWDTQQLDALFSLYSDGDVDGLWFSGPLAMKAEFSGQYDDKDWIRNGRFSCALDAETLQFESLGTCRDVEIVFDFDANTAHVPGKGHVMCHTLHIGDTVLEEVKCALDYQGLDLSPFTLFVQDKVVMRGGLSLVDEMIKGFIEESSFTYQNLEVSLGSPSLVLVKPGYFCLKRLNMCIGSSHVQGDLAYEEGFIVSHQLSMDLDLDELSSFLPTPLRGKAQAQLTLGGTLIDPALSAVVTCNALEPVDFPAEFFPAQGVFSCVVGRHHAFFRGECRGKHGEEIEGTFDIPLSWDHDFWVDPQAVCECHVRACAEVSPYMEFLMSDSSGFTGQAHANLHMMGPLEDLVVQGQMRLEEGTYESLVLGSMVQDISAQLTLEQKMLRITQFQGRDFANGQVRGEGFVVLDQEFAFELHVQLDQVELLNLDYAEGILSGDVTLSGSRQRGKLSGALTLNRLDVHLPDQTPASLNALEVTYVHQDAQEKAPTLSKHTSDPYEIDLDLSLFCSEGISLSSEAIASKWRANLQIEGSLSQPLIYGRAKLLEGFCNFSGKTFPFSEGSVNWNGDPGRKTTLYLIAKQQMDDLKIEVIVKGSVKDLELSFRSNPPKSQREILSYLLFDRGIGDISAYESEELMQSMIRLKDQVSQGPSLLDRLKSSFGIDRIEFIGSDQKDPDEMSLRVGKYISHKFFLSFMKSMNDKPNHAAIEADLSNHFKAQAEVSDDREAKLLLKWERDY